MVIIKNIKKRINNKGFTLFELIIVIAILGILSSYLYIRLFGFTEKADEISLKTTAYSLKESIELFMAETDQIPLDKEGKLSFNNSSLEFNLTNKYELDNLESLKNNDKSYKLELYELKKNGERTGRLAIITEEKITIKK